MNSIPALPLRLITQRHGNLSCACRALLTARSEQDKTWILVYPRMGTPFHRFIIFLLMAISGVTSQFSDKSHIRSYTYCWSQVISHKFDHSMPIQSEFPKWPLALPVKALQERAAKENLQKASRGEENCWRYWISWGVAIHGGLMVHLEGFHDDFMRKNGGTW